MSQPEEDTFEISNNQRFRVRGMNVMLTLTGDSLTTEQQMDDLLRRIGVQSHNQVLEYYLSKPALTTSGLKHQHLYVKLKSPTSFQGNPIVKHTDGTQQKLYNVTTRRYTERTKNYEQYIEYIKKHGMQIQYRNPNYEGEKKDEGLQGVIRNFIQNPNQQEAEEYFAEIRPKEWYLSKEKWIRAYEEEHAKRRMEEEREKALEGLLPFKQNLPEAIRIKQWINEHKPKDTLERRFQRDKILFVVGNTKLGKTEYIDKMITYNSAFKAFKMKGTIDWSAYNNKIDYDFYIIDDPAIENFEKGRYILEILKSITTTRNGTVTINVKYSHRNVKHAPIIYLCNSEQYIQMWNIARYSKNEAWLRENSQVVQITERLYYTPNELENLMATEEPQPQQQENQPIENQQPPTQEQQVPPEQVPENSMEEESDYVKELSDFFQNKGIPLTEDQIKLLKEYDFGAPQEQFTEDDKDIADQESYYDHLALTRGKKYSRMIRKQDMMDQIEDDAEDDEETDDEYEDEYDDRLDYRRKFYSKAPKEPKTGDYEIIYD